jgi:hypothetical protein
MKNRFLRVKRSSILSAYWNAYVAESRRRRLDHLKCARIHRFLRHRYTRECGQAEAGRPRISLARSHTVPMHAIHGSFLKIITAEMYG